MDDLVRLLDLLAGAHSADGDQAHSPGPVDMLDSLETSDASDPPLAVATVVNTRGSAYRRPGARMLIRRSLSVSGAVSAGCLERDVIANCEGMKPGDSPLLLTYDGSSPDELVFGLKLGCDGIVQILIEAVDQAKFERVRRTLPAFLAVHGRIAAVTIFEAVSPEAVLAGADKMPIKTGLVMLDSGVDTCSLEALPLPVEELLAREARLALLDGERHSLVIQQKIDRYDISALIEIVEPVTSLMVFGSGQDVAPLVDMAKVLGWRVTVTSSAQIDKLDIGQLAALRHRATVSAAIVMTHDYERDKKILHSLFMAYPPGATPRQLPYIGVVGPRRRTEKLLAELALAGISVTEKELAKLYSPVGLDIGAERPEEIALSILAEIKAVIAGHCGGLLREKQGPIHEPTVVKTQGDADMPARGTTIGVACRGEND